MTYYDTAATYDMPGMEYNGFYLLMFAQNYYSGSNQTMRLLKESTANQTVIIGPFVNDTDGKTPETGLTIANTDIQLSKAGAAAVTKNSGGATHIANGNYAITFDATDSATLGQLAVMVKIDGALGHHSTFEVIDGIFYDAMQGNDYLPTDVTEISGDAGAATNLEADYDGTGYNKVASTIGTTTTNTDMRGTDSAATAADLATVDTNVDAILVDTGTTIPAALTTIDNEIAVIDGNVGSVLVDTAEIGAAGAGLTALASQASVDTVDVNVDAILVDTQELQTDNVPGLIAALDTVVDRIEVDTQDIQTQLGTAGDGLTALPEITADMVKISGDTVAADNLEAMFDGTGYVDDTAPSSRSQVDNFTVASAAISVAPRSAPDGFVLTTGINEVNDEDSTVQLDGVLHTVEDDGGTTDVYYEFDIGAQGVPTTISWQGYARSNGNTWELYAWNWAGAAWEQIGIRVGKNNQSIVEQSFNLTTGHVGTGAELGLVRFRLYSTDGTRVAVDRILCSYAIVNESVGYANGAIWVDTNATNTNTVEYVDGVADNPVSTWAAALALNTALGLNRFRIAAGSAITLTNNSDYYEITGASYTLDLGSQSVQGLVGEGATVTGLGTAATIPCQWSTCAFGAATIPPSRFDHCEFGHESGQFTAGSAGDYTMIDCVSGVPGSGSPVFVFTGLGATTGINNRRWAGGSMYTLDSDCTLSHEVLAGGGTTVTTGGANVELRGLFRSLNVTMAAAEMVQFVGVTGPVTLSGTTTGTVNLYGVCSSLSDTTTAAVVTDSTVSIPSISGAVLDEDLSGHSTAGTLGKAITDIEVDTSELQTDDVPGLLSALDTVVDRVEADTQDLQTQIGTAGAGLTALNDLSAAAVAAELATYDAPTKAEFDAGLAGLNDPSTAAIVTALLGASIGEPSSGDANFTGLTLEKLLGLIHAAGHLKATLDKSSGAFALRNSTDTADIVTGTDVVTGAVYTRGERS